MSRGFGEDDRFFYRLLGALLGLLLGVLVWQSCVRPEPSELCEVFCSQSGQQYKSYELKGLELGCECGPRPSGDRINLH
jgi:hypothetical protein